MYARKLLPDEVGFRAFSDLKTLHVVISHNVFTGHEFDLGDWVKVARGGPSLPALNGKCSVVKVEKINDDNFSSSTSYKISLDGLLSIAGLHLDISCDAKVIFPLVRYDHAAARLHREAPGG